MTTGVWLMIGGAALLLIVAATVAAWWLTPEFPEDDGERM
jgi:hypothetical protein